MKLYRYLSGLAPALALAALLGAGADASERMSQNQSLAAGRRGEIGAEA